MNMNVPYLRVIAEKSFTVTSSSTELSLVTLNLTAEPSSLEVGDRVTLYTSSVDFFDGLVWKVDYTNKQVIVYAPTYSGSPSKLLFRLLYLLRGYDFGVINKVGLSEQDTSILGLPINNPLDRDNIHISSWDIPIALSKIKTPCVGLSVVGFITMVSKLKSKTFTVEVVDVPGAFKHRLFNAVINNSKFSLNDAGDYYTTTLSLLGTSEGGF